MVEAIPGMTGIPGIAPAAPAARPSAPQRAAPGGGESFEAVLERRTAPVQFSRHAAKRIEQRGLQLDETRMRRLEDAVERAEQKGSRDSLILLDELALVVSVRSHTVVTAMDEDSRKEHVFTNIDSVVIAE
jgi:flagellar operon protein